MTDLCPWCCKGLIPWGWKELRGAGVVQGKWLSTPNFLQSGTWVGWASDQCWGQHGCSCVPPPPHLQTHTYMQTDTPHTHTHTLTPNTHIPAIAHKKVKACFDTFDNKVWLGGTRTDAIIVVFTRHPGVGQLDWLFKRRHKLLWVEPVDKLIKDKLKLSPL